MANCSSGKAAGSATAAFVVAVLGCMLVGCQSHTLNSQLLERELRLQEDQIYRLQDVLDEKCARLEYVAQENASLKRQLGYGDAAPAKTRGPQRAADPPVVRAAGLRLCRLQSSSRIRLRHPPCLLQRPRQCLRVCRRCHRARPQAAVWEAVTRRRQSACCQR